MTNGGKLELLNDWVWQVLKDRNVMGHTWARTSAKMDSAECRFLAGSYVAVEFTYSAQLWMHVWTAHKVRLTKPSREFSERPKSIKLKWSRSARETAHNAIAVIEMVADAIECCNTYRVAGEERLHYEEAEE